MAVVVFALVGAALLGFADTAAAADDAETVFCMSPSHEGELRDAALALEKVDDISAVDDLTAWRDRDPDAFATTCSALFRSEQSAPAAGEPSALVGLLPFLTAVAGALFTFLFGSVQAWRADGRHESAALRQAMGEFGAAVRHYADVVVGDRPLDRLRAAHAVLLRSLAEARVDHPGWDLPRTCHDRLTSGDLSLATIMSGWKDKGADKGKTLRASTAALEGSVLRISAAMRGWLRRSPIENEKTG